MSEERVRVLIAKPGLDGHDRGAKVVARGLRDAGFEVVYTGLHRTPVEISEAALQEDEHAVGLSVLSGAHNRLLPEVVKALHEREMTDVLVVAGGIIPDDDVAALEQAGVSRVFPPGSAVGEIADFIKENHPRRW